MKIFKRLKAFTMAEVLVSLTIIGILSILTIPAVVSSTEKRTNAALLRKAVAKLDMVYEQAATEEQFMPVMKCFYWRDSDVSKNRNEGCKSERIYNDDGLLTGWKTICPEGVTSPENLNGRYDHCSALYNYMLENMKVTKSCTAAQDGCIPNYDGKDVIAAQKTPQGDDESDEQFEIRMKNSVKGCEGWSAANMRTKPAFITNDGMIFMPYSTGIPIFAVDVNGKKGPNKFGYDVFFLTAKGDLNETPSFYPGGCDFYHKGGTTTSAMLNGKY